MQQTELHTEAFISRQLQRGICAVVLFGCGVVVWSVIVRLDSAVVTQGAVVVESNVKKVQHPTGGVVGTINVREGQRVNEGDVVVRLDETATKSALSIIVNDLTAGRARLARLVAERDGAKLIMFPEDLLVRARKDAELKAMIDGENRLFTTRQTTRLGQKAQLTERIGQLNQDLKGLADQQKALHIQLSVANDELKGLRGLMAKGLTAKPRVTAIEREVAKNDGQLGELVARTSSLKGKIVETELQIHQLDKDQASEVSKDLREVETKINEQQERRVAAEDQLKRVDIRAPISGVVHQLTVHTVGGVVSPTEPLMLIVPETDRLIVEVRIQPQDIDQVHAGLPTRVRFTAFNQRTTPELMGILYRVAGDVTKETQTGLSYFTGGVAIEEAELSKLHGLKLIPGMPADAFIKTGQRTFASYIVKPLTDQMLRSMRER
jgi:HlyD family secretion protein